MRGRCWRIFIAPTGRDRTWNGEIVLHCHNGGSYDIIHYSITPLGTLDGDKIGSVLVIRTLPETTKKCYASSATGATHDALTILPTVPVLKNSASTAPANNTGNRLQHHALVFIVWTVLKRLTTARDMPPAMPYCAARVTDAQYASIRRSSGPSGWR